MSESITKQYYQTALDNFNLNGAEMDNPEILFISSYPPRECGIATYTQDLIKALDNKFGNSFQLKVCALETGEVSYLYPDEVKYVLNTSQESEFSLLASIINEEKNIKIVFIQHEFGLFRSQEAAFHHFLYKVNKPIIVAFHSVLPLPDSQLREKVRLIAGVCKSIVVMTNRSAEILVKDYEINSDIISVIAHGTHLVPHLDKANLKQKYNLTNRKVLATFGLLSSGKGIETTLFALPDIIRENPEVVFLIIGKTHPVVVKAEGEIYRKKLEKLVADNNLERNVIFINSYLELPDLLEYLQLTDIYLFTSIDPNQAVSGTFAYAMSCACPIISTPIPHAKEVLSEDCGFLIDFGNSKQLADAVNLLLKDEALRTSFAKNSLQKIVSTVWENSALAHAFLIERISEGSIKLVYSLPGINLNHLYKMTTDIGIIQFSKINQPDENSGYTLDDNARALYCFCKHYKDTGDEKDLHYIRIYFSFLKYCQQESGRFLNYVSKNRSFTDQNQNVNLDDSNGRAFSALAYLVSLNDIMPADLVEGADLMVQKMLPSIQDIESPRAMSDAIKGLYILFKTDRMRDPSLLVILANRLVNLYHQEEEPDWQWFENSLTYANSILPEAMVYAWLVTNRKIYMEVGRSCMNFLLSLIYTGNGIEVISNRKWYTKGSKPEPYGEQSIDVASTIHTLSVFYHAFGEEEYFIKMQTAFNWFLGKNRLHQIIYNPCTGGCYDGLEEKQINLNEGAESSLSYLMSRLIIGEYQNQFGHVKGILIENNSKEEELPALPEKMQ